MKNKFRRVQIDGWLVFVKLYFLDALIFRRRKILNEKPLSARSTTHVDAWN
jgi:hypothetical protein